MPCVGMAGQWRPTCMRQAAGVHAKLGGRTCDEGALPHKLAAAQDADLQHLPIWQRPHDAHLAIADDKELCAGLSMPYKRLAVLQQAQLVLL